MRIFGLLLFLGVIYIITYLVSQIVLIGLGTILGFVFRMKAYGKAFRAFVVFANTFTLYIITSLITITILTLYEKEQSQGSFILYAVVGAIAVFGITTNSIVEKLQNGTYRQERERSLGNSSLMLRNDVIINILSVPFFVLTLFLSVIISNPITKCLFRLTAWAVGLPIIGWLLAILGLLLSLSMVKNGIIACIGLLAGSAEFITKKSSEEI